MSEVFGILNGEINDSVADRNVCVRASVDYGMSSLSYYRTIIVYRHLHCL